ncbi:lipopolysaccharide assembly protein LapB [Cellulophaga sp. Hel_I_12]|uniref:tetratricopeptide repeat protein n=1 Tax=Cellulophaga sp. Hel_I_12 TaxID=1249972 RepID=UPI00064681BB|nr:CDC27 family protein [Cellulophaga sp. Hel_I_12]
MALDAEERPSQPITKFESMLKTDDVYFFDSEDFEDIIHHYLNNGKISLAKKAIKIGLQQHPNSIELKLLHVEVLVFEDKLEAAQNLLDELQIIAHSNEEIYIQRANIHSKKNNHPEAVKLLERALELTDDTFDIYALLGMEYLFMDDFEMAKKSFMKCVDFDEEDYSSLYNVIYCFEFLEDFDGAISYLNDYLEKNPYSEVAWHQLGKQYFSKKKYKKALTAYDFAIISDDTFLGAYFEKGKVLEKLGKYNEAIENYETTISIEDPTSHAYLRIGKCHEKLGNIEMAKYHYYQTVHEDPLLDKGWLAITDFYFRLNNYQKAGYYINKALNIDAENPRYWKKCGKIKNALKKYDEADYAYKQAIDFGDYDLDTWLHWAAVVVKNKEYSAAIEILKQGREFHPEEASILFQLSGLYSLVLNNERAKVLLAEAIILDADGLPDFQINYPKFCETDWVKMILKEYKKTSK